MLEIRVGDRVRVIQVDESDHCLVGDIGKVDISGPNAIAVRFPTGDLDSLWKDQVEVVAAGGERARSPEVGDLVRVIEVEAGDYGKVGYVCEVVEALSRTIEVLYPDGNRDCIEKRQVEVVESASESPKLPKKGDRVRVVESHDSYWYQPGDVGVATGEKSNFGTPEVYFAQHEEKHYNCGKIRFPDHVKWEIIEEAETRTPAPKPQINHAQLTFEQRIEMATLSVPMEG